MSGALYWLNGGLMPKYTIVSLRSALNGKDVRAGAAAS